MTGVLIRRRNLDADIYRGKTVCEDRGRRWLSTSQEGRPQKKPTLLTPRPQTSNLQNCEDIDSVL